MPIDLSAVNINRTTADITWVVPSVTYGRETYIVRYGVSLDSLSTETETIPSGLDTSLTYQSFSVTLKGLQPFTQYYFRVLATNILATTSSDAVAFTTRKTWRSMAFTMITVYICFTLSEHWTTHKLWDSSCWNRITEIQLGASIRLGWYKYYFLHHILLPSIPRWNKCYCSYCWYHNSRESVYSRDHLHMLHICNKCWWRWAYSCSNCNHTRR